MGYGFIFWRYIDEIIKKKKKGWKMPGAILFLSVIWYLFYGCFNEILYYASFATVLFKPLAMFFMIQFEGLFFFYYKKTCTLIAVLCLYFYNIFD